MTLDLDKLEAVAKAATPEGWKHEVFEGPDGRINHEVWASKTYAMICSLRDKRYCNSQYVRADANHIAAFAPPTALALIAQARDAEKLRAALRELIGLCEIAAVAPAALGRPIVYALDGLELKAAREALKETGNG